MNLKQRGVGLVEYAILISFVVTVGGALVASDSNGLSGSIKNVFSSVVSMVSGEDTGTTGPNLQNYSGVSNKLLSAGMLDKLKKLNFYNPGWANSAADLKDENQKAVAQAIADELGIKTSDFTYIAYQQDKNTTILKYYVHNGETLVPSGKVLNDVMCYKLNSDGSYQVVNQKASYMDRGNNTGTTTNTYNFWNRVSEDRIVYDSKNPTAYSTNN